MPCILHCNAKKISNTISSQVLGQAQLPGVFNGIISSPYPQVTLDTFGFPVDIRLAAQQAVFWPGLKMLFFYAMPI